MKQTIHFPDFELDTDCGYLSGAEAVFEYRATHVSGADYTGPEVDEVELVHIRFGGLALDRSQVERIVGDAELDSIETAASERIFEQLRNGELAA